MNNLFKIFVLGLLALGFVACDKISDTWESIQLSMAKQCVSKEDKIKGCVEVKETKFEQDIQQTRTQYKDGKSIYRRTLKNDVLTNKEYLETIDNNYIVRAIRLINTSSPFETYCVSSEGKIVKDDYLLCNGFADNTKWRKTWCNGKLCENCELSDSLTTRYINGVCKKFDDIQCFANGKKIKCDEQERQKLLSQDFSDFYKRCVSDNFNGFTIYPAPCKEE